ncbi:hypothetical protein J2W95_000871 [Flavobacterium granuli]|uniref:Uncharacterized protein n=1 Tax=Flavobacterium granuli TaxID=280093 RepID=A0ABU1RZH1_9FLAO|nr:hypothetical protein [Flavobacterium granuli]
MARILESDKAENLASLLSVLDVVGLEVCSFSSETTIGLVISTFSILILLLGLIVSFLETSTME